MKEKSVRLYGNPISWRTGMRFIAKYTLLASALLMTNSLQAGDKLQTKKTTNVAKTFVQDEATHFGKRYSIESKILGESRELLIHLPKDYQQGDQKYPVLYLLDGSSHFRHAVLATEELNRGEKMPQVIIVGITNNKGTRGRDAYNEQDNFLSYIEKEVIPMVDKSYNTSGQNILFGHSAMGFVTMAAFAKYNDVFDKYIAASPAVTMQETQMLADVEQSLSKNKLADKYLYFSIAEKAREVGGFTDGVVHMSKIFEQKAPAALTWQYDMLPMQNHTTTPYLTMFMGLGNVFTDYEAPVFESYQDFAKIGGIQGLKDFYIKRSDKYQTDKTVPQGKLVGMAYTFMYEGSYDQAITLLQGNLDLYKDKMQMFGAMGEVYAQMKNQPKAIKAFKKALDLAIAKKTVPAWQSYYEDKIAQLEKESTSSNG